MRHGNGADGNAAEQHGGRIGAAIAGGDGVEQDGGQQPADKGRHRQKPRGRFAEIILPQHDGGNRGKNRSR